MGNQSSNSSSSTTTTTPSRINSGNRSEKLLRRNKRTAYHVNQQQQQQQQIIPIFSGANGTGIFPCSEPRTSRSRSLEPQCAEAVKVIEHSQSARYPKNRRIRQKSNYLSPESAANLQSSSANNDKVEEFVEEITICNTGLTQHQKLILQKIWMIAGPREIIECGKSILSHLLRTNSTLFAIFHLPQCPETELIALPGFIRQAANFAMVFDFVMTNLIDDLEKVCFALESLGRHHTELGFTIEPSMWSLFQRVIEDNPPKAVHQNAHGHPTWKLMVSFLIRQMRVGYNKALEEQETQKGSNPS
uniref:Neuroglobin n=1 Tax=Panagrolaimus sp. PS1159 TaxID=55785 RepID=A0AC35EST9_9BILA